MDRQRRLVHRKVQDEEGKVFGGIVRKVKQTHCLPPGAGAGEEGNYVLGSGVEKSGPQRMSSWAGVPAPHSNTRRYRFEAAAAAMRSTRFTLVMLWV